ncbi:Stanniocalcin-2 [Collichthys lucidus]|uniref:Stanniocalcin n=1 Tax=Collichthys lucidus TaxID=240159 RepID=A0A4V6ANF4_COLLU|nr:Stanniocalcin-2 [Collichthys lucidus]
MLVKLAVALLVLSVLEQVVGSDNIDIHDSLPEKPASQKGRLSLQNTAEIQHCLGKSFIKDALKCMAHGLRHKFSCISRKCVSIKEMVFQLQRECYIKHNLCSAAKENVAVMVEMIHFQDLFPKGPYVELVNILLSCGEEPAPSLNTTAALPWPSHPEPEHPRPPRQGDKEKPGKAGFNAHPRNRSQGPRRQSPEAGVVAEQEDPEATDIRR